MPVEAVTQMRNAPMWPMMEAVAPKIIYDIAIMEASEGPLPSQVGSITVPMLVMTGGASPAWMHNAAQVLANALPDAQHRTLSGQTHNVEASVLAPVLGEFFKG